MRKNFTGWRRGFSARLEALAEFVNYLDYGSSKDPFELGYSAACEDILEYMHTVLAQEEKKTDLDYQVTILEPRLIARVRDRLEQDEFQHGKIPLDPKNLK